MEQQTINEIVEAIRTMRSMLADLARDVQQLKEGREEKKELPPLKPLLEKTEEREESEGEGEVRRTRRSVFRVPSKEEIHNYLYTLNETRFSAEEFWNYYQARGWMLTSGTKMKDWKACIHTWISKRNKSDVNFKFPASYGQQRPQQPQQQRPAESAAERAERERQQRLRSLEAAVARKLG